MSKRCSPAASIRTRRSRDRSRTVPAVIVIICHPLQGVLRRRGWPMWTATTAVVVLAYVILTAMALLLWLAGRQFARLVVDYLSQLQATVTVIEQWLASMGWDQRAADTLSSFLEPTRLLGVATSVSGMVVAIAVGLFFVLAYVIFMAADAARYRRLGAVFGESVTGTVARIRAFNVGTRRYYIVNAIFGAIVAVIDGPALAAIGVPAPWCGRLSHSLPISSPTSASSSASSRRPCLPSLSGGGHCCWP